VNLSSMIDHTLLNSTAQEQDIRRLVEEAIQWEVASICVQPCWIPICAQLLASSGVKICTVVGFPLGGEGLETKVFQTGDAIKKGAQEIDMVVHLGAALGKQWDKVEQEIHAVREISKGHILKIILETAALDPETITRLCEIGEKTGVDFVKTSTGFGAGGASLEAVRLMARILGNRVGIKASGGIKNTESAMEFIHAGATRLGTSSTIAILKGDSTLPQGLY